MKRTIIKIDEKRCNGCGACVSGCHEGALQMIDGKARIVSELYCDGLGACIGDCPVDAITLEEREAEPYDEIAVMERLLPQGEKTIIAHLKHLKEHGEMELLKKGIGFLQEKGVTIDFSAIHSAGNNQEGCGGGCPGGKSITFEKKKQPSPHIGNVPSQLSQWPVQLHLLNPEAAYFKKADVVLAADCSAFAYGNFHSQFIKDRILAIACPKLDSNKEGYVEKLTAMINNSNINTLTVVMMEVPCCGGLLQLAQLALSQAKRKIPIKKVVISLKGEVLAEEWT